MHPNILQLLAFAVGPGITLLTAISGLVALWFKTSRDSREIIIRLEAEQTYARQERDELRRALEKHGEDAKKSADALHKRLDDHIAYHMGSRSEHDGG